MVNIQHVYDFCSQLKAHYGAGFRQQPMVRGIKIVGEYYTATGQLLEIAFTVYKNKVETRIYDSSRRLIFNDSSETNINQNTKVVGFIQRSINTY